MTGQNEAVLARLKLGPLTAMDALRVAGTWRLAARVYDLRLRGHIIETRMIDLPTGKRVAEYRLRP